VLPALADAFAELERRADRVTAEVPFAAPRKAERRRWPVVAAAAAGVAVVATGAALLAQAGGPSSKPAAGGGSSPVGSAPVPASPSVSAQRELVPSSPAEIARRFRAVLGDTMTSTATFTVTDTGHAVTVTLPSRSGGLNNVPVSNGSKPNGAAIVGQLTAGGVTGGYDVQMLDAHGEKASCDTPVRCSTTVFADGATLAVGRDALEGGGVTFVASFVRADGTEVLMHVSNRADPKGAGARLADKPPLTTAQLRAIVTSDLW
jgi:hypothetical protein